ncbi:phage tail tape measure protein [Paenibacillus polysaccharolyticus]|uniref:phage tail tape measure protein n=1 Tax=Paenibacillus polysaccharolyticus TaxID=582692 RepID=UPI0030081E0C
MSSDVELNIATNQMITDLNKALREIASKMNSLKVKVDFDPSFLQGISSYADGMNRLNHTMIENKMLMQSSLDEYKRMQINQERLRNMTAAETAAYEKQRVSIKRLEQELAGYTLTKDKAIKNHAGVITGYTKTYKDELGQLLTVNTNTSGQVKNYDKVMEYAAGQRRALNQKNLENQQREATLSEEQSTRRALEQQTALKNAAKDDAHRQALQQNTKMNEDLQNAIAKTEARINQASQKYNLNGKVSNGLNTLRSDLLLLNSSMSTVGYKATAENLALINERLKATTQSSAGAGGEIKTLGEVMKSASAMAGGWMSNVTSLIQPMDVLRKAIQSIISMDGQMNQLERSIGSSFNEERMLAGSNLIAQSTGRSMSEVNGNLIGFANQGFDQADTLSLGKAASVLQNISSLTPAESVNTLSLAMASFNIEADKSMSIADKLKEVSGIYGVSSKDLALSLTSAGAAAKSFGVSIEELLGNTAAISSITRESGDVVGRGLKSIYTKLGSDEQSKGILESVGISKADKDVTTLLDELAGKWNQLTKAQQQNTALGLAGQDQTATFTALMQNWGTSLNASESALHSQGAAMKDNEIYMGSLGARIQNMQTAWEGLTLALGNALVSDTLITITSLVTGLLNWMSKLGNGFVGFGVAGIAVGLLSASLRILTAEVTRAVLSIMGIPAAAVAASAGTNALSMSVTILKNSFKALLASTGVGLVFALIGTGLEFVMGMFSSTTQATEDFSDKTEALNQKVYDLNGLKALSAEYEQLSNQASLNFEEKTRLAQIESELSSRYGITTQSLDGQTKSLSENTEAIKRKVEQLETEAKADRLSAEMAYNMESVQIEDRIKAKKTEITTKEDEQKTSQSAYIVLSKKKDEYDRMGPGNYDNDDYKQTVFDLGVHSKRYETLKNELAQLNQEFQKDITVKADAIKGAYQDYINQQEAEGTTVKDSTRKFVDIYVEMAAQSEATAVEIKDNAEEIFNALQEKDFKTPEEALNFLQQLPNVGNLTIDTLNKVNQAIAEIDVAPLEESIQFNGDLSKFNGEVSNITSEIGKLNSVINNLSKGQSLSAEEMNALIQKYPELAKHVQRTKDGYTIEKNALESLKKTKVDYVKTLGLLAQQELNNNNQTLVSKLKAWGIEIEALSTLAGLNAAKAEVRLKLAAEVEVEDFTGKGIENQAVLNQSEKDIQKLIAPYYEYMDSISDYSIYMKNLIGSVDLLGIGNEKSANSADKATNSIKQANNTYTETTEVLTELQKKIQGVDKSLDDLHNRQKHMETSSAAYRKSLMEENSLLEQKKNLLQKGIDNPEKLVSTKIKTSKQSEDETPTPLDYIPSSTKSYTGKYANFINKYAQQYNVDPNMIAAIIQTESGFNPSAKSPAGAVGLMQLMPDTAKGLGVKNSLDPEQNIKGGTQYFSDQLVRFKGNVKHALAAYNAGPNRVNKWVENGEINNIPIKETKNYVPKVIANYNSISGIKSTNPPSSTSKSSGGTSVVVPATSEELNKAAEEKKKEVKEIADLQLDNRYKLIDSWAEYYELQIDKVQTKISKSASRQSMLHVNSEEWRKEEQSQISYVEQQIKLREQEIAKIKQLLQDKKITSESYNKQIAELESKNVEDESQIYAKREKVFDSYIGSYTDKLSQQDHLVSLSNSKLRTMTEGSSEYNKELSSQVPILQEKNRITQAEITFVEKLLAGGKLNADQTVKYTNILKDLNVALLDNNSAINDVQEKLKSLRENAADKIIEDYKKVIEQQRDLALDAIDEQRKAEDKRHEERNKNLDEEQKKFETYINARFKALDRENSSTDYAEELTKKKNERQKIVDKLNVLSLDNSMEAKAKRKDLTEQLTAVDEEIAKYERDRSREMVKQGLQDQLEDRKNYNDQLKEEEDKLNKDEIDKLDDKKKKTERHYKDILENEKSFYQLKQNLMSNDVAVVNASLNTIGEAYKTLFDGIRQHVFETSVEMENLIYKFAEPEKALAKFKAGDYSSSDSVSQTSSGSASSGSLEDFKIKGTTEARRDWTYYLDNKSKAENIRKEMGLYNKDSYKYQQLEKEFKKLQEENQKYRDKYQFPDNSYAELLKLKIFSADTGGLTPAFTGAKFLLAHEKELILNQSDTSNLLKIVDVVRGITDRIKTGFDFGALKFSQNDVAGTTDNRIQIDKVEIVAKDQESGMSLLGKFEEALNNKLKLRTI